MGRGGDRGRPRILFALSRVEERRGHHHQRRERLLEACERLDTVAFGLLFVKFVTDAERVAVVPAGHGSRDRGGDGRSKVRNTSTVVVVVVTVVVVSGRSGCGDG